MFVIVALLMSLSHAWVQPRGLIVRKSHRRALGCRASQAARIFSLNELTISRYVGETTFNIEVTYDGSTADDNRSIVGAPPTLTRRGRSSTRFFQATLKDPSIRSRGGDPRVILREIAAIDGSRRGTVEAEKIADAEVSFATCEHTTIPT